MLEERQETDNGSLFQFQGRVRLLKVTAKPGVGEVWSFASRILESTAVAHRPEQFSVKASIILPLKLAALNSHLPVC